MTTPFRWAALCAALSLLSPAFAWNSSKVQYDGTGRLTYPEDANASRIPDYSHAGYKGGGVPLPNVPVRVTISPVAGDDTASIQAAVDAVGAMPLQADGYRGAVRLTAGVYDVTGTIRLNHSGVVLAGVGHGDDPATNTILRRTGTSQADVITAGGGSDDQFRSEIPDTRRPITTQRVSVGSRAFNVDDASGFAVGDNIIILHPSTAAWIAAMDNGGVTDSNTWKPGQIEIRYHRYITAISGNTIVVDAPVFNHLDRALSQSFVFKYDRTGVLTNIGVEQLQIDIVTAGPTAETHAKTALRFIESEDSWVRDCTMKHFWYAGVEFAGSTRGTAERVRAIEPHSVVTGGRRYNFATAHSQLILFKDCHAHDARHGYVANGTSTDSGNVALNSALERNYTFSEGHRRWSTGLLFDGIVNINRRNSDTLGFYNRGNYGTGHGWGAGHSTIWNSDAAGGRILVQRPPTAQNYAIGCFGNVTGSGPWAGPVGFIEGSNTAGLQPQSLYLAQLADRQTGAPPIDLQPPTAPTLSSGGSSPTAVVINWTASTDNVGVSGYDVFADDKYVGTTTGTTLTANGLTSGTTYAFTVQARDEIGNTALSDAISITTQGAPPAPEKPTLFFEAEHLTRTSTGGNTSVATETFPSPSSSQIFASNFQYVSLSADGNPPPPNGEWMEFTLPDIPAGTYDFVLRYKSHPNNRGRMVLAIDGVQLGGELNQRASATFREFNFGVVRFLTAGSHVVRLTISGKDSSAAQWGVNADRFALVPDNAAPIIAPIADRTVEATGPSGAVVTYTATATDNKDGSVPVTFEPPSGSTFPLGQTIVVASAEDFAGNIGANSFAVTVVDTTPPTLSLPAAITAEATSPDGAAVGFSATAFDLVSGDVEVALSHPSGSTFPLGTTTVEATAEDDFENVAAGSFAVTVHDTTPPVITAPAASPNKLWPPNHKMVPVKITATANDAGDAAPHTRIVSVTSNESANGQGDGNTAADWIITGDLTLELRAERSGKGDGRIYTITIESRDASGNSSTSTVNVTVPHDNGK